MAAAEKASVDDLGYRDDGITQVVMRFGYMQRTDTPRVLAALEPERFELPVDLADASYFLSTIDLPSDRTVIVGSRVTL